MSKGERIVGVVSFVVLAAQVGMPWTIPHYVTQDGPSHRYTAMVAKNLVLHPASDFSSVYQLNPRVMPNWASTILFNAIESGEWTEKIMTSFVLLAGFFSMGYAIRSFAPDVPPWSPLINFVLQTWFLGMGFYNFYLAIVVCPLLIGFYVRRAEKLTVRHGLVVAAGLVALFFTHLLGAGIAMIAIGAIAVANLLRRREVREIVMVAASFAPVLALMGIFALGPAAGQFELPIEEDWMQFPQQVFGTRLLWPVVGSMIAGALVLRNGKDSPQDGLAVAILAVAAIYVAAPSEGLGGSFIQSRLAWAIFVLGVVLAGSARRLEKVRVVVSIYAAAVVAWGLMESRAEAMGWNAAAGDYLKATEKITRGARLARVRYPVPEVREPTAEQPYIVNRLLHFDAEAAVRCGCVDLGDYQAASGIFPVEFKGRVAADSQMALWSLEGTDRHEAALMKVLGELPVAVDYVVVVGRGDVEAMLGERMRVVGESGMVKVYGPR